MRHIDKIILHCTATPEGRKTTVKEITAWHKARGFRTIGYHYVIQLNGVISRCRPENQMGAHCKGQNKNSIGISYVGGVEKDGKTPKDTRTPQQKHALRMLVETIQDNWPDSTIHGHYEFSSKDCPSFKIEDL